MKRRNGFTLIELMVVMGLMVLISSIVVSGSFGMTRSSSYRVAESTVFNTLQMARQLACTDGKRVVVAFADKDNALSVVVATGTIWEDVKGAYIQDRCANLAKYTGSGVQVGGKSTNTVWNLRTGAKFSGFTLTSDKNIEPQRIPGGGNDKYAYAVSQLTPRSGFDKSFWKKGDPYGFQVTQPLVLPKGFKIGFGSVGSSPGGRLLVFEPDGTGFVGTSSKTGITQSSTTAELYLYEEIFSSDAKKAVHIKVANGIVSVIRK